MNEEKIDEVQEKILAQHPNWSSEKARWLAMQCLGIVDFGVK